MTGSPAIRRILDRLGDPALTDRLAALPGADLTTLLMEVMRLHTAHTTENDVLRRYATDRFSKPGAVPAEHVDAARAAVTALLPSTFESVTLAPLVPLGTHAALGSIDQNNVVSTVRGNEVAADNTAALALEAALRRRQERTAPVHLAAAQRITRAQPFSGPLSFAHFEVFAVVTAGRDTGNLAFEREAVADHVEVYVEVLARLSESVRVQITDYSGRLQPVVEAVIGRVADRAEIEPWPERPDGGAYYAGIRFTVHAVKGGDSYDLADGGLVDWTQRLLSDRKERMVTSGIGLERLATLMHR